MLCAYVSSWHESQKAKLEERVNMGAEGGLEHKEELCILAYWLFDGENIFH